MERRQLPECAKQDDHWVCKEEDGKGIVMFSSAGRVRFQIEFGPANELVHIVTDANPMRNFRLGMQHALMLQFSKVCIGLHGVTISYQGQNIVLSAPSGTGKTTLAKLLQQYCGAEVINGDFAFLSIHESGGVVFEPTPFCGTSGQCVNSRVEIDRIVFLSQAKENKWVPLKTRDVCKLLLDNVFVPEWDGEKRTQIHESVFRVIDRIPIEQFAFMPEAEAAKMFITHVIK